MRSMTGTMGPGLSVLLAARRLYLPCQMSPKTFLQPKCVQNVYAQRKKCTDHGCDHEWVKTGHYEDEWFSWIKEGGLFSRGYDTYVCSCCGRKKEVHV